MYRIMTVFASFLVVLTLSSISNAGVVSSSDAIVSESVQYNKQQLLSFIDGDQVQERLVALGVDSGDAKMRISMMTSQELAALNAQMDDLPAGGILGTIVTVVVVIAVLDLLGVTDVFDFIDPIT